MDAPDDALRANLRALSAILQQLHLQLLNAERPVGEDSGGLALLERITNDPAWAWLRHLTSLIAEIDHALAGEQRISGEEGAHVASRVRSLLLGLGDHVNEPFLQRYRTLLPFHVALASLHGQVRRLLEQFPAPSDDESERLHARHVWAMRLQHGTRAGRKRHT